MGYHLALVDKDAVFFTKNANDISSLLDYLYGREDYLSNPQDYDLGDLEDVFGFTLKVLTPVTLTRKYSPLVKLLKLFKEPRSFVDEWDASRCFAGIWTVKSNVNDYFLNYEVSHEDEKHYEDERHFVHLLQKSCNRAKDSNKDIYFACYPGWSYEDALENKFPDYVKGNLKKCGMVSTTRTPR